MPFRLMLLAAVLTGGAQPCSMFSIKVLWGKSLTSESKLFLFEENGKVGFIDATGEIVTPATIDTHVTQLGSFSEGLLAVSDKGFVDETGKWAFQGDYYSLNAYSDGLAAATVADESVKFRMRTAYLDKTGTEVFSAPGRRGESFSEGLAVFAQFGKPAERSMDPEKPRYRDYPGLKGYFDKTGEIAIEARFADAGPFKDGLARVAVDGYCHLVTASNGREGSPTSGYPGSCGGAPDDATSICPIGFIDKSGDFAIDPRFEGALDFSEGYAGVRMDGKWGYIDRSGDVVIPPRFEQVWHFREGLAAVQMDGKWGFVDETGAMAIAPRFEWPTVFSEALASVRENNRTIYINPAGDVAIPGLFLHGSSFVHGLAAVQLSRRQVAYINKSGETVFNYFQN